MGRRTRAVVSGVLCASFLLFASGCATVFKGEYRTVRIKSEPDGAMVFINGEYHGRTPVPVGTASQPALHDRVQEGRL